MCSEMRSVLLVDDHLIWLYQIVNILAMLYPVALFILNLNGEGGWWEVGTVSVGGREEGR